MCSVTTPGGPKLGYIQAGKVGVVTSHVTPCHGGPNYTIPPGHGVGSTKLHQNSASHFPVNAYFTPVSDDLMEPQLFITNGHFVCFLASQFTTFLFFYFLYGTMLM